ncbi:HTTM domain-containing protein [Haloarcula sp. CBA1130]|uniref:HTTM domain-containing protein n=1 Tax=unclassified Haloarcula TaxID=2624677 RepID=UPI001245AC6E|nr:MULTISPECIES: HTTM domain-containing protein [unclassified Haloarcula]KAA9397328.1 HTTM domain-containing protein [Haloarcula sp. CBA1129]KAA9402636.1 HTTM domain-containing protein [Haloarcula sp. CBA1130]
MNLSQSLWEIRGGLRRRFAVDPRALAVFRMVLGLCLIVDVFSRLTHLTAFYTASGALPRPVLQQLYPSVTPYSLLTVSGTAWVQFGLFVVTGLAGVALLLGYRPRLSALLSLVLLVSIHIRNPFVLNAGDTLLRRLLFWSLLLPLGTASFSSVGESEAGPIATAATVGTLLQVVAVYSTNALVKLRGDRWLDGTAVRYVFELDHITIGLGNALGGWPLLLTVLDWTWLAMLVGAPLLILLTGRRRTVLTVGFIGAHLCMATVLRLGPFPLICISGLLLFLPPDVWETLSRAVPETVPSLRFHRPRRSVTTALPARSVVSGVAVLAVITLLTINAVAVGFVDAPAGTPDRVEDRSWDMFAPAPSEQTWWYVAPATLDSGTRIDALTGGPVDTTRPADAASRFPGMRWKKFLGDTRHRPQLRRALATYFCTRWNRTHDDRMERVTLAFMTERTRFNASERVERTTLGTYECA